MARCFQRDLANGDRANVQSVPWVQHGATCLDGQFVKLIFVDGVDERLGIDENAY